jgi:hypothetical protein
MSPEVTDAATTNVPAELSGPLPRKVRSGGADYLTVVMYVFLIWAAALLGWYGLNAVRQTQYREALRSNGRLAVGAVTRMTYHRGGKDSASYAFSVRGATYTGKARLPRSSSLDLHQSDHILIRYLPSDPTINHPADWEWSAFMDLDSEVMFAFLMAVFAFPLSALQRIKKLAREGMPAEGVVKGCTRRDRVFRVEYEFCTANGDHISGACNSKDSYQPGKRIWILYLPQKPRRNYPYMLTGYHVVG